MTEPAPFTRPSAPSCACGAVDLLTPDTGHVTDDGYLHREVACLSELDRRLSDLAYRHRSPGARLAEQRASRPCSVCGEPGHLMPRGVRCTDHGATINVPTPLPPSPPRPVPVYGTATTDPLGREGDGWRVSTQTRLPTRDRDV